MEVEYIDTNGTGGPFEVFISEQQQLICLFKLPNLDSLSFGAIQMSDQSTSMKFFEETPSRLVPLPLF